MDHDDGIFDEETAAEYDDASDPMFDPAVVGAAVDLLAELAGDGPALELGIGTGRIALPLAARGIAVHGIDLSRPMVARLRAKPGGADVPVTIGDFATADLAGAGPFTLVYLVYNTVMNLTTQAAQVDAFRNAARHLAPGGCFLIEVGVLDLRRLPPGERYVVFDGGDGHWGVDEYDVVNQGLVSHHLTRRRDGRFAYSTGPFRYVWPAELDLMARLAGLGFAIAGPAGPRAVHEREPGARVGLAALEGELKDGPQAHQDRDTDVHPADVGDPRRGPVRRPGLAVRGQVGRVPVEALVGGDAVQIQTRGDQDAGRYFGSFLEPPTWIAASGAIVDGRSSHSTTAANPTSRSSRPGSRVAAVSPRNRHRSSTRSSTCSSSTGGRSSTSPSTSAGASSPRCSGRTRASG